MKITFATTDGEITLDENVLGGTKFRVPEVGEYIEWDFNDGEVQAGRYRVDAVVWSLPGKGNPTVRLNLVPGR